MPKSGQQKGTPTRRAEFIAYLRTLESDGPCIAWPWSDKRSGYTRVFIDGEKVLAHRWVYEQFHGPLARQVGPGAIGPVVMHACDVRWCVRPGHLSLGTQGDNIQDAVTKGRMGGGGTRKPSRPYRRVDGDEAEEMRRLVASGIRQSTVARLFGVTPPTVSFIVNGKTHNS